MFEPKIPVNKFSCLLEKGKDIPVDSPLKVEKQYTTPGDDITEIKITIFQANSSVEYISSDGAMHIGEFRLSGIPPKPQGREVITVCFEIDQQNLLKIRANSSSSSGDLDIQRS